MLAPTSSITFSADSHSSKNSLQSLMRVFGPCWSYGGDWKQSEDSVRSDVSVVHPLCIPLHYLMSSK